MIAGISNRTFCEINSKFVFSIAIDKNGQAWTWGANSNKQLGYIYNPKTPMKVYLF